MPEMVRPHPPFRLLRRKNQTRIRGFARGSYSSRTSSEFSPRIFPKGGAFDTKGSCVFDELGPDDEIRLLKLLVIIQSRSFRSLVNMCVATSGETARSYTEALIEKMPIPSIEHISDEQIKMLRSLMDKNIRAEQLIETTHGFCLPDLQGKTLNQFFDALKSEVKSIEDSYISTLAQLDRQVASLYGIDEDTYREPLVPI
jgi:hypothetical protein